jgi:hypothetical protein
MRRLRTFPSAIDGAAAGEFALVLPLFILLVFGVIDMGRLLWTVNQAEKAVQVGVRHAVVTNLIPAGLRDYSFVSATNPAGGSVAFGAIECTGAAGSPTCSCISQPCTTDMIGTENADAHDGVISRMRTLFPEVDDATVRIRYEGVGLGYAGNPHGSDVSPLVTVEMSGASFTPATALLFATFRLPDFEAALTMEDGQGTDSN